MAVKEDAHTRGSRHLSVKAARLTATLALTAYPAGALILAFSSGPVRSVLGFGLLLFCLVAASFVLASPVYRIVGGQAQPLDEYQLVLRLKALGTSYSILAVLLLIAIFYAAVAADRGSWVPSTYGEYNAIFWGALLYAVLLPSAVLAWQLGRDDEPGE